MKRFLLVMILLLSVSVISASPEFWIGGSFIADRNMVSSELSSSFPAMGEDISQIRSLGVSVDMAFFPWNEVRVGLVLSSLTQLPIGITERGGSNEGYITYDLDYRQDASIGLAYYQFFTDKIGAFLTCSFEYSWYRTATEHIPNDSRPMEYVRAEEYGILGEIGIMTRSDDMYFRLGFNGFYDLKHRDAGYRLALFAGGGIIID